MKPLLLFLSAAIFGLSPYVLSAQSSSITISEPVLTQYTPTPQTWSFIKYGNTPVDYYTGTAQVDVPLYEYSDPDFRLSLSAGYASNGFLPQRQTGILGLNWFLNCGGAVTRDIRGLDDFAMNQGLNGETKGFLCNSSIKYTDSKLFNQEIGIHRLNNDRYTCSSDRPDPEGDPDTEVDADIFHFSFMGHSGSFHYDGQRNVRVYDTQGNHGTYKIQMTDCSQNTGNAKITITTGDGYIYVFGGQESALERSVKGGLGAFGNFQFKMGGQNYPVVSWFLTSVTAPNGRKITLKYDGVNDLDTYINKGSRNSPYYVTSFQMANDDQTPKHHRQVSLVRTSYLTKITVDNSFNIDFAYTDKNCKDLNYTRNITGGEAAYDGYIARNLKKLESISISYLQERLRTCNFAYRIKNDRLILKSIDVSGVGEYKMSYYEPYDYPGLTTSDVDFWGYYNGKDNNYEAFCPMKVADPTKNMDEVIEKNFKNPDWKYSIIGCLQRIEYPTKGFTEFEYEANTAQYIVLKRERPNVEEDLKPVNPTPEVIGAYLAALNDYSTLFLSSDETGGVRIRKIMDYDITDSYQTREYNYVDKNDRSSGCVMYFPRFYGDARGPKNITLPLLQYPANTFDKSHIGYGMVREIYADGSSTKYEFNTYKTRPDDYKGQTKKIIGSSLGDLNSQFASFYDNILREPNSRQHQRGKLHTKTMYNADEQKVFCEKTQCEDHDLGYSAYVVPSGNYTYSVKKPIGDYRPVTIRTTEFFGQDSLWNVTEFGYNALGQQNQIIRYSADNRGYVTDIEYLHETSPDFGQIPLPLDYRSRIVEALQSTRASLTKSVLDATKYTYAAVGNMIKPKSVAKAQLTQPITVGNSNYLLPTVYKDKVYYDAYDSKGNPVQVRDASGTIYSYIWGYGGRYPVAKVLNASFAQIQLALGLGGAPLSGGLSKTQIDRLYAIAGAYVDVYDYKPLVGLIEHTDPSGKKFNYEYDVHGRLSATRDALGPLQTYEYHL